ncbi:unnamed protein product [Rangifer tarandus platyrhynchus]|uniref:Uncharacterized protein n=2 Tax=Rangifer tarandus platyrhynchus TaxID=3082113 RepID=A0ABN8Y7Q5_RANTA|nr:unnamed protein product [Rangifer tarandus platyrhynchus]CAI9696602.1 unnamed protein product [Rangifer tarandus platyrhynchus]
MGGWSPERRGEGRVGSSLTHTLAGRTRHNSARLGFSEDHITRSCSLLPTYPWPNCTRTIMHKGVDSGVQHCAFSPNLRAPLATLSALTCERSHTSLDVRAPRDPASQDRAGMLGGPSEPLLRLLALFAKLLLGQKA